MASIESAVCAAILNEYTRVDDSACGAFGQKSDTRNYNYDVYLTAGMVLQLHIELTKAGLAEKPILHNLSQFYLYEFSKYMPAIKLEDHNGLYDGLPDLDEYWDNPNREPFILHVDGELAGFVLVIKGTAGEPNQIGEFFVMDKFGGKGIGKTVAKRIFDMFPGNWLIHEMWNNYKAQAFWRSAFNSYTNGKYHEYYDEHRRPFQQFTTQGM